MKFFFLILLFCISNLSFSQDYTSIRKELEEINILDQKYRIILDSLVRKKNLDWNDPQIQSLIPLAARQDSINLVSVVKILDQHGWLGVNTIGAKANETLFLIVQHADTTLLIKYFPLLVKSYELGESPGKFYAMMLDRILIENGQKQVYGTQFQMWKPNGEPQFFPIENEGSVDMRRKKVGLLPMKEYLESLKN